MCSHIVYINKLGLTKYAPCTKYVHLVDDTLRPVWTIMENVLVKVVDFFYRVGFMLMDINDSLISFVPIILGQDFLAMTEVVINC